MKAMSMPEEALDLALIVDLLRRPHIESLLSVGSHVDSRMHSKTLFLAEKRLQSLTEDRDSSARDCCRVLASGLEYALKNIGRREGFGVGEDAVAGYLDANRSLSLHQYASKVLEPERVKKSLYWMMRSGPNDVDFRSSDAIGVYEVVRLFQDKKSIENFLKNPSGTCESSESFSI